MVKMDIDQIIQDFRVKSTKINKLVWQREQLEKEIDKSKEEIKDLEKRLDYANKAKMFIQEHGINVMSGLKFQLEKLVNVALDTVLINNPVFSIDIVERRDQLETDLKLNEEKDMDYFVGGGALDITSFALRLSCWSLQKNRPVFVLDEPFRNLSDFAQGKVSDLLKDLTNKLRIQIIMMSHVSSINKRADKTFEIDHKDGETFLVE